MTKAELFFFENAGSSYDPKTETPLQGNMRNARELANAEAFAKAHGWTFEWVYDSEADPNDWDGEGPIGDEAFGCILKNEHGKTLESLWGIWDPTPAYQRVVEAELAFEAKGIREQVDAINAAYSAAGVYA